MLTLYFSPGSCSRACHVALEESGLAYEGKRINFAENQQRSPDYLKLNPKGRVPALVTPKGILTEAPAIMSYVAQTAPDAKLAPLSDPFEFARMQAFNSYIASTVHVAHAHGRRGTRWANQEASLEDMKAKMPQVMTDCFTLIENEMLTGPWVLGSDYSVADGYLFVMSGWLKGDGVDVAKFPKVHDHYMRMQERPAVKRALEAEQRG